MPHGRGGRHQVHHRLGPVDIATCRIASRLRRLGNAGVKVSFTDRTSEARALQHSIGVWLRRRSDEAKAEVLVITGQLAELAAAAVAEATNALHYKARRRRVLRMLEDLAVLVERTMRVVDQARARVLGDQPAGATRLVSLHEPDARPIREGRLGKPVEFGYKAQVIDNPDGLILDHSVHIGTPPTPNCCVSNRTDRHPSRRDTVSGHRGPRLLGLEDRR